MDDEGEPEEGQVQRKRGAGRFPPEHQDYLAECAKDIRNTRLSKDGQLFPNWGKIFDLFKNQFQEQVPYSANNDGKKRFKRRMKHAWCTQDYWKGVRRQAELAWQSGAHDEAADGAALLLAAAEDLPGDEEIMEEDPVYLEPAAAGDIIDYEVHCKTLALESRVADQQGEVDRLWCAQVHCWAARIASSVLRMGFNQFVATATAVERQVQAAENREAFQHLIRELGEQTMAAEAQAAENQRLQSELEERAMAAAAQQEASLKAAQWAHERALREQQAAAQQQLVAQLEAERTRHHKAEERIRLQVEQARQQASALEAERAQHQAELEAERARHQAAAEAAKQTSAQLQAELDQKAERKAASVLRRSFPDFEGEYDRTLVKQCDKVTCEYFLKNVPVGCVLTLAPNTLKQQEEEIQVRVVGRRNKTCQFQFFGPDSKRHCLSFYKCYKQVRGITPAQGRTGPPKGVQKFRFFKR